MATRMAQQQRDARGPRGIRPRGAVNVRARAQKPAGWPGLDIQARDVAPDPRQKVEGMPGPRDCPAGGARSRRTIRSALHSSAGRGAADLRRTASCDPPSGSGTGQTAARIAGAKDPRAGPSAPRQAFRPVAQGRVGRPSGPVWPSVEHSCGQAGGGWRAGRADPIRSLRSAAPVCLPGPRRFGHVNWNWRSGAVGPALIHLYCRAGPPVLSGDRAPVFAVILAGFCSPGQQVPSFPSIAHVSILSFGVCRSAACHPERFGHLRATAVAAKTLAGGGAAPGLPHPSRLGRPSPHCPGSVRSCWPDEGKASALSGGRPTMRSRRAGTGRGRGRSCWAGAADGRAAGRRGPAPKTVATRRPLARIRQRGRRSSPGRGRRPSRRRAPGRRAGAARRGFRRRCPAGRQRRCRC